MVAFLLLVIVAILLFGASRVIGVGGAIITALLTLVVGIVFVPPLFDAATSRDALPVWLIAGLSIALWVATLRTPDRIDADTEQAAEARADAAPSTDNIALDRAKVEAVPTPTDEIAKAVSEFRYRSKK